MRSSIAEYVAVAVGVHAAAVAIVNITPTPRDNETLGKYSRMVAKLYRAIELLAGIITPLAKR